MKDCLNPHQLRYSYQPENQPWVNNRRRYFNLREEEKKKAGEPASAPVSDFGSQPRPLIESFQVLVQRPKTSWSKNDKEEATEVLAIEDIKVPHGAAARFDVYVARPMKGQVGPDVGELAGSFVNLPHAHHKLHTNQKPKSRLELGITSLVEDIEAESSENLVVTILPRMGDVTVGGVHIVLLNVDYESK